MHVRFCDIDDAFIKEVVEQGFYLSETECVRDAVRRMRQSMQMQPSHRFVDAVAQGKQAVMQGQTVPLTPDLMTRVKEKAIQKHEKNEGYHGDDAVSN
jgi:Arc/MetJ-type ribon-helix-helix transcriptional regulator